MKAGRKGGVGCACALVGALAGAGPACRKDPPPPPTVTETAASSIAPATLGPAAVAEILPRCRAEGRELAIPGEDVVVGDALVAADALVLGVVRRAGGKRVGTIVHAPLDLAASKMIDVGAAVGEEPPPSPRLHGSGVFVVYYTRKAGEDAGAATTGGMAPGTRTLHLAKIDAAAGTATDQGTIPQQADESPVSDVAWPETGGSGSPIVAWDEDAPIAIGEFLPDRGRVKVQLLADGTKAVVASPYASDADSPKLLARARGGFYLAWLARRPESTVDAGLLPEGPGEHRVFRWIEVVELDAKGEVASPIRRVSPDKGHVVAFDLVRGSGGPELLVVAQDEAAHVEHAGARIVRYAMTGDRFESSDLVDAGVGHALSELVASPTASVPTDAAAGASRWLAWMDGAEHAHLLPLGGVLTPSGAATLEPALDGARVLAAAGGDAVFVLAGSTIRRFVCR